MYSGIIAWIILLAIGAGYLRHKLTEDREITIQPKGRTLNLTGRKFDKRG